MALTAKPFRERIRQPAFRGRETERVIRVTDRDLAEQARSAQLLEARPTIHSEKVRTSIPG